ncbi:unnamed protein product [Rotaria sp. Silwood1]|nr:unnamed protein product [Rotaria sp. Silwood1]CAF4753728.1 unnamed protein product [Rotaria sp. Silwood1]
MDNILRKQEKYNEAFDNYQKVLAICEEFYSSNYKNMIVCLSNNADVLEDQKKYNEALLYRQRALTIKQEYCSSDHDEIANNLTKIGQLHANLKKYDKALEVYQQALSIREQISQSDQVENDYIIQYFSFIFYRPTKYTNCLREIDLVWNSKTDYDRAAEYFEKCLCIREASLSLAGGRKKKSS